MEILLPQIKQVVPDAEIIVVNDGSTDDTHEICQQHGVRSINNPYSKGNGAAIKSGARAAKHDILVFMDADSQHQPREILKLVNRLHQGYDMVVGARSRSGQASFMRSLGNRLYNKLASSIVEHEVADLTSGFRAARATKFREFINLLPNGFSYPTTITMAFFRSGYSVYYEDIEVKQRIGKSHIHLLKDGARFFTIIFKIAALYSPLKIFMPLSLLYFATGMGYYLHTYFAEGRLTNMAAILFITSMFLFLTGLISEQITMLLYQNKDKS